MEQYRLIDMLENLDASILEELHLEKDLKRQQNAIRRMFANGHVKFASITAGIGLAITGVLIVAIRVKKRRFLRRTV